MKDASPSEPPDEGLGYRAAAEVIAEGTNPVEWLETVLEIIDLAEDGTDLSDFAIGARRRVAEALERRAS